MQAPATLTGGNRFNRMTAGAIGLAVLAASALGAVALNERVELPLIGGSSEISAPANTTTTAEIEFFEQNSWERQPSANYASVESIRLIEDNTFDYPSAPVTTEQMRFLEENIWNVEGYAQPAGEASATGSAQDFHFLEENIWDRDQQLIPPADTGATDY
jgi:hypothetical protein